MSNFGVNLATPLDYTGCEEFIDAFKTARGFQDLLNPSLSAVLNPNGLPAKDAKQVIFTDGPLEMNGEYHVLYKGQMKVGLTGGSPADLLPVRPAGTQYPDHNVAPIVVRAKQGQSAQLHLTYTEIRDLSEIKILRPGYTLDQANNQVFTDRYLKYLDSLGNGPLRSMSWLKTNSSPVVEYHHFTEVDDLFWRGDDKADDEPDRGAPIELFWLLAAKLKRDVWINIPHMASDACVVRMAEEAKKWLSEGAWVYLEYTNEHWNTDKRFSQSLWLEQQPGVSIDKNERRTQNYAKRFAEIVQIWRHVFGRSSDRIRPILAGHIGNSQVLKTALKWLEDWHVEKTNIVWGLAVTGYFGSSATDLAGMRSAGLSAWRGTQAQKFFETCKRYNKAACVYEGGASSGDAENPNLVAMHLDPAMEQIVSDSLLDWKAACDAAGVQRGPYMYFLAAHVFKTLYGLTPHVARLDAPKARGFRFVATQDPTASYVITPNAALLDEIDELKDQLKFQTSRADKLDSDLTIAQQKIANDQHLVIQAIKTLYQIGGTQ